MSFISQIKNVREARKQAQGCRCQIESALARRICYIVASARYFARGDRDSAGRLLRLAEAELILAKVLRLP